MKSIEIRTALASEIPAIMKLGRAWVQERITYTLVPSPRRKINAIPTALRVIAWKGDLPVGYAFGEIKKYQPKEKNLYSMLPRGSRYFELLEIFVSKGYRAEGVGSALLKALIENVKKLGVRRFSTLSKSRDIRSIEKFYEKHGFETYMVHMAFVK